MSTIKITELPELSHLSTNTDATLIVGVDLATSTTSKLNLTTLGEGLYAYQPLKVGQNQIQASNVVGQFSGNSATYLQVINQNYDANGSSDIVAMTSDSDNLTKFVDIGINGSKFADPAYSSMRPYDAYVFSYGPDSLSASGNLVIGTASSYANIVYIVGGTVTNNIVARMTKTDFQLSAGYNIKFGDGSIQSVAASPANYSQAAYAQANLSIGINSTQNTNILATNDKMESAYSKANNALANTTGTFAGSLTITSNTTIGGYVSIAKSDTDANTPLIRISASADGSSYAPSNSYYILQLTGKPNNSTRLVIDDFGSNSYPVIVGRSARGTVTSPTATANNDVLFRVVGNGYTGTQFASSSPSKIDFVATENFSNTNRGTAIQFWNTPTGSNTIQRIATFNANEVNFTGAVYPQKGFIYAPVIYSGAQTAITIDMSDGPLVKAQTSTGLTVTLSNFVAGKAIELWITNTAGTGQTFTHGVSATNSTVNSTTYSIPATASIVARYVCFDGTLANTMCSIIHA